ncbi:MAG: DoxX family protein [Actinomycetota bacterium]|nr:DoxX family protein [Actinomycetota bacterium]
MAYHGFSKLFGGLDGVTGMFEMMEVPAPPVAAPVVTFIEIVAGLALIAGIGTRIAAPLLAIVLLGALVLVKVDLGIISSGPMPGAELDLALLAGLVALLLMGPGDVSADRAFGLAHATAAV